MLLLAIFASAAHAQDRAPVPPITLDDRGARVDEALRLSDFKAHLTAIRARLFGYLEVAQAGDEAKQWVAGSLQRVYSPDVYLKPIRQALLDDYDAGAMTRVLAWYRSPAGRKITRLEGAASQPGQGAAARKYLAGLENKQPSDYRLVLIFSIDEARHTSAGTASALRASINGWFLGIEQLPSEEERPAIRQIEASIREYRGELRDDLADDVLRELMYAYRDASDGDLRAYAEFLESDAGRWFIGTAFKAHQGYFEGAADLVAEDFVSTATRGPATPLPAPPSRPKETRPQRPIGRPDDAPSLPARR